ncbi:SDR family oxidoreductase [Nocardioides stalactiti]|uniref:SDR family oxidoreductase n=1 Tax=Nocardioides stalactiti TaxID=2755356 RepID=UPI0016026E0B|nr:SDR family oxidoreductase [Nocardioides stalactiti]
MPVAIITGGARGIGRAIAAALLREGYSIAIGDLDGDLAASTATGLTASGVGGHLDVSDAESFAGFVKEVESQLGAVDLLVNNAGIMPIGRFLELDPDTVRRTVDVNLVGVLNGVRAVLPGMVERGSGHIVNISSIAGKCPPPGGAVYAATKAGVLALGESLRQELAPQGVRVSTVLPSFTNTDLVTGTKGLRGIRNLEPEEVAQSVVAAVRRNHAIAYAPTALRHNVRLYDNLPGFANELLAKAFRGDRAFLDVDRDARRSYDDRIGQAAP